MVALIALLIVAALIIALSWPALREREPIPYDVRREVLWANAIYLRDGEVYFFCTYCEGRGSEIRGPDGKPWNIDHVWPYSHGGTNQRSNLTLACATCNQAKSDSELGLEWRPAA